MCAVPQFDRSVTHPLGMADTKFNPLDGLSSVEVSGIRSLPPSRRPKAPEADWTISDVAFAWTQFTGNPFVPLNEQRVDEQAYQRYWKHCLEFGWLPLFISTDVSAVISSRPHQPQLRREVGKMLRCEVYWSGCTEDDFDRTVSALGEPQMGNPLPPPVVIPTSWKLEPQLNAPDPYRQGVIEVLHTAYKLGASDVFLDDESDRISVRFRLSGVAEVFPPISGRKRGTFLGSLKKMASISPNERYKFHDARFSVDLPDGNRLDIRAAFAPTLNAETVALRLQDSRKMVASGMRIPLPPDLLHDFVEALGRKGGMILITGPTGSGKTTTLYAALLSLDRADLVIRTIEDPVEITLPGISQTPVGADTGRSFGQGLKSFLRLNPDVILVGEIRDEETAALALEASLTGHTLLSTLHAQDCVETITRYANMFPKLDVRASLASTLGVVLSQRLAPRLCQACKEPRGVSAEEVALFGRFGLTPPTTLFRKHGCPECGTGVRGRVPIFEQLVLTSKLRDLMTQGTSFQSAPFRTQWVQGGGKPMGKYALELAAQGLITYEEAKCHMVWVPDAP